jgi:hypothetical protein
MSVRHEGMGVGSALPSFDALAGEAVTYPTGRQRFLRKVSARLERRRQEARKLREHLRDTHGVLVTVRSDLEGLRREHAQNYPRCGA